MRSSKPSSNPAFFVKRNGARLPVDDDTYLLPFLSPKTPGTHYRDSPPPGEFTERQRGRVLLQIHQFLHLLQIFGVELEGRTMLDIGTGNGMVPRLLLELSGLSSAVGTDPYLEGEHLATWQVHDRDAELQATRSFIFSRSQGVLRYEDYADVAEHETHTMLPGPVALGTPTSKPYRFEQIGAHDVAMLGSETFDLLYCKAIEHIPDWPGVFRAAAAVTRPDGVFYLKHRPFFSYMGAHRYSSIGIPWGHVLLSDGEYRSMVEKFYPEHTAKMTEFFFHALAYPRVPVSRMIRIAQEEGFVPLAIIVEPSHHVARTAAFVSHVDGFWEIVRENYPEVGADELFSSMYHILLSKAA